MESCKICQELQERHSGTAPIRCKYHQPSMYDHMLNYAENKKIKENAELLRNIETEILKQNPKFTDLQLDLDDSEALCRNFCTQNVANFRKQKKLLPDKITDRINITEGYEIKLSSNVIGGNDNCSSDEINQLKHVTSSESFLKIPRCPINCPVSGCQQTIGITTILSHFLRDHTKCFPVDFADINGNGRSVLIFKEDILDFNQTICLGVLAYGGRDGSEANRPGILGISRPNAFLTERYANFSNHLPILIMACKTSICNFIKDKEQRMKLMNPEDRIQDIIVIWCTTVETTKTIQCTITAFDQYMKSSRSTIVKTRNVTQTQNPEEFIANETNFLLLTRGEIDILSKNEEHIPSFEIEVLIHEFE